MFSLIRYFLFIGVLLSFFPFALTFSQDLPLLTPQGLDIQPFSGYGNSSINNSVSEIGRLNPAAILNFNGLTFGTSTTFSSSIDNIIDEGTKLEMNVLPANTGLVYNFGELKVGLVYHNFYNSIVNQNKLSIKRKIISFSALASYPLYKHFNISNVDLGIKVSNNSFTQSLSKDSLKRTFDYNNFSFDLGIIHNLNLEGDKYLRTGIVYASPIIIKKPSSFYANQTTNNYTLSIPSRIKLDFEFNYFKDVLLSAGVNYISRGNKNFFNKDVFNFSINSLMTLDKNLKFSYGWFSATPYNRVSELYEDNRNFYYNGHILNERAIYMNIGFIYVSKFLNLDITFADSRSLFSDEIRKETIFKLAAEIKLDSYH